MLHSKKRKALLEWFNCVGVASPLESLQQLADGSYFVKLVNLIETSKNEEAETAKENFEIVQKSLNDFFQTHSEIFINFPACVNGEETELAKTALLLLSAVVENSLSSSNSALCSLTQLDESIQLDIKECIESVLLNRDGANSALKAEFSNVLFHGSKIRGTPNKYSSPSSPPVTRRRLRSLRNCTTIESMVSSPSSPLKALLESPQMVQQVALREREREVSNLRHRLHSEENRNCDLETENQSLHKKVSDKEREILELKGKVGRLRKFENIAVDSAACKLSEERYKAEIQSLHLRLQEFEGCKSLVGKIEEENKNLTNCNYIMSEKVNSYEEIKSSYQTLERQHKDLNDEFNITKERCQKLEEEILNMKASLKNNESYSAITKQLYEEAMQELRKLQFSPAEPQQGETMKTAVTDLRIGELETVINLQKNALTALNEEKNQFQASQIRAEEQVTKLKMQLETEACKFEQFQKQYEDEQNKFKAEIDLMSKNASLLKTQLESQVSEKEMLVSQLQYQCNSIKIEKDELSKNMALLKREKTELGNNIIKLKDFETELKSSLTNFQRDIFSLNEKLSAVENEKQTLINTNKEIKHETECLNEKLMNCNNIIKDLQVQLEVLSNEKVAIKEQSESFEVKCNILTINCNVIDRKFKTHLTKCEQEKIALRIEISTSQSKLEQKSKETEHLKKQMKTMTHHKMEINQQLLNANCKLEEQKMELEKLGNDHKSQLKEYKNMLKDSEIRVEEMKAKYLQTTDEKDKIEKEMASIMNNNQTLEMELGKANEAIQLNLAAIATVEKEYLICNKERKQLSEVIENKKKEIKMRCDEIRQLQEKSNISKEKNEAVQAQWSIEQRQLKKNIELLTQEKQEIRKKSQDEKKQLQAQVCKFEKLHKQYEDEQSKLRTNVDLMAKNAAFLKTQLESKVSETEMLEKQLRRESNSFQMKTDEMSKRLTVLEKEKTELGNNIAKLKDTEVILQNTLSNFQNDIYNLNEKLYTIENEKQALICINKELECNVENMNQSHIREIEQKETEMRTISSDYETEIKHLNEKFVTTTHSLETCKTMLQQLESDHAGQLKEYQNKLKDSEFVVEEIKAKYLQTTEEKDRVEKEMLNQMIVLKNNVQTMQVELENANGNIQLNMDAKAAVENEYLICSKEKEQLNNTVEDQKKEIEMKYDKITELEEKCNILKNNNELIEAQWSTKVMQLEENVKILMQEKQEILEKSQEEIILLRKEISDLSQKVMLLQNQLENDCSESGKYKVQSAEQMQSLKSHIDGLTENITLVEERERKLQEHLSKCQTENSNLKSALLEVEKYICAKVDNVRQITETFSSDCENQILQKDLCFSTTNDGLKSIENNFKKLEDVYKDYVKMYQAEVYNVHNVLKKHQEALLEKDTICREKANAFESLQSEFQKLSEALKDMDQNLQKTLERNASIEEKYGKCLEEKGTLNRIIVGLKEEEATNKCKIEKLNTLIGNINLDFERASNDCNVKQDENLKLNSELEHLISEKAHLGEEMTLFAKENEMLKTNIKDKEEELSQCIIKYNGCLESIKKEKDEINKYFEKMLTGVKNKPEYKLLFNEQMTSLKCSEETRFFEQFKISYDYLCEQQKDRHELFSTVTELNNIIAGQQEIINQLNVMNEKMPYQSLQKNVCQIQQGGYDAEEKQSNFNKNIKAVEFKHHSSKYELEEQKDMASGIKERDSEDVKESAQPSYPETLLMQVMTELESYRNLYQKLQEGHIEHMKSCLVAMKKDSEMKLLEENLKEMTDTNFKLEKKIENLENENQKLLEKLEDIDRNLQTTIESKATAEKEYFMCVEQKEKDIDKLQKTILELQETAKKVETSKENVKNMAALIANLTSENKANEQKYLAEVSKKEALKEKIKLMQNVNKKLKASSEIKQKTLEHFSEEMNQLQAKVSESQAKNEKMKNTLIQERDNLSSKYEYAKKIISRLETEKEDKDKIISKFSEKIENYQNQSTVKTSELNNIQVSLRKEHQIVECLKLELEECKKNLQPLQDKYQQQEAALKRQRQQNHSLEAQLQLADSQIRRLKQKLEEYERNSLTRRRLSSSQSQPTIGQCTIATSKMDTVFDDKHQKKGENEKVPEIVIQPVASMNRCNSFTRTLQLNTATYTESCTSTSFDISTSTLNLTPGAHGRSLLGTGSRFLSVYDEEDFLNHSSLADLKSGSLLLPRMDRRRISELQRRNTLCLPHMRSSYPVETQMHSSSKYSDDALKTGNAIEDSVLQEICDNSVKKKSSKPGISPKRKRISSSDSADSLAQKHAKPSCYAADVKAKVSKISHSSKVPLASPAPSTSSGSSFKTPASLKRLLNFRNKSGKNPKANKEPLKEHKDPLRRRFKF